MKKSEVLNTSLGLLKEPKLTIGKAAQALGISRNTFKKYLEKGELPLPLKIGTQEFWLERDLEHWIINQNPHLEKQQQITASAKKAIAKLEQMRALRSV